MQHVQYTHGKYPVFAVLQAIMYPRASSYNQSDISFVGNRVRVQVLGVIRVYRKKSGTRLIHHGRLMHGTIGGARKARETLYRVSEKERRNFVGAIRRDYSNFVSLN